MIDLSSNVYRIRRLKKALEKGGVFHAMRKREHSTPPSARRRQKSAAVRKRIAPWTATPKAT
jgi:ribosomal protein S21